MLTLQVAEKPSSSGNESAAIKRRARGVLHRRAWILLISCYRGQENLLAPEADFLRLFHCPMRILLIGGNGFIGRFAVRALTRQGHALAVFHRGTTAAPAGVEEIRGNRNQLSGCAQELKRFLPDVVIDLVISSGAQAE